MWKLDESYFYRLKRVAMNRLSAGGVVVYLMGLCEYSFVILGTSTWVLWGNQGRVILGGILTTIYFILVAMLLMLIIYLVVCIISEKFIFKSQKFAAVAMVVYTLVMSVEPLFLLYLFYLDRNGKGNHGFGNWVIATIIAGCIQFVMYFMLVRNGVKVGSMKKDGIGMFRGSRNLKRAVTVTGLCFSSLITWLFFIEGSAAIIEGCIIFLFLLFALIGAVQEFIILTVCRYRFATFSITYKEATKHRERRKG
ncbi:hypothetical protein HB848_14005 [Listeria rocourtiae]|uniref:hypothetical protein n=1 Tax=Listeria rocourtiae TaxID=647910 RepID=UPI0016289F83|nr:hypothetical protein [Listeria rocourtiae]MBC1436451.1 hypothetical protein [Listeria rocourtiae]